MISNQTYKYLTIVLLVIIVALLSILSRGWGAERLMFGGVKTDLAQCQTDIEAWRAKYSTGATVTADARAELSDILSSCNESAEEGVEATQ